MHAGCSLGRTSMPYAHNALSSHTPVAPFPLVENRTSCGSHKFTSPVPGPSQAERRTKQNPCCVFLLRYFLQFWHFLVCNWQVPVHPSYKWPEYSMYSQYCRQFVPSKHKLFRKIWRKLFPPIINHVFLAFLQQRKELYFNFFLQFTFAQFSVETNDSGTLQSWCIVKRNVYASAGKSTSFSLTQTFFLPERKKLFRTCITVWGCELFWECRNIIFWWGTWGHIMGAGADIGPGRVGIHLKLHLMDGWPGKIWSHWRRKKCILANPIYLSDIMLWKEGKERVR